VVLRLTAPKLTALPWETQFDPGTGTYLCRREPLVRHVPPPYTPDPLQVRPLLQILGLGRLPAGFRAGGRTCGEGSPCRVLAEPVAEGAGRPTQLVIGRDYL
jgi:hypothetical protein